MEPKVYNEFQLPEYIWEDGEDVVIVEHNDIYNDPIYRSSDDDISDGQEDVYQEDGFAGQDYESEDSAYKEEEGHGSTHNDSVRSSEEESSVCSFHDHGFYGWQSSEDEDQESEGAAGYLIDYNRINQMDEVWEAFILATRTSYLLGDHGREWHWFWRQQIEQQIEERTLDITRGYSEEESPT